MLRHSLIAIFAIALLAGSARGNEVCDAVNKIVASGLDAKRPFAAVAALQLPNAHCYADVEERYYSCAWKFPDYESLGALREEYLDRLTSRSSGYRQTGRELKKRLRMAIRANRQSYSVLHSALDGCFDKRLVHRAREYGFKTRREDGSIRSVWSRKGGCAIILKEDNPENKMAISNEHDGIEFSVWCDEN